MPFSVTIRDLGRADLSPLHAVLDATGLFPSDLLAPMAEPYLSGQAPHLWLVAAIGTRAAGFAYAEPERMTDGTFNLLAIAVDPALQGQGIGTLLVEAVKQRLAARGGRVLLVETSSLADFAATRAFYSARAFHEEARIRDFYADGEAKVTFRTRLRCRDEE